jgi:hypothetical protein
MAVQVLPTRYPFWKVFFALLLTGLIGVISLLPLILEQVAGAVSAAPELAGLPDAVIVLISLINPLIILAVAVAVGTLTARHVGLRSLIAEKAASGESIFPELRPTLGLAAVTGLILAVAIYALDWALLPFTGLGSNSLVVEAVPPARLVMGLLYGGITEELLLRWGFLSLLAWLGWRVFQGGKNPPSRAILWGATLMAAVVFGIAHLPAMAAVTVLTPMVVLRTVFLNTLGGMVFGWLFWRYNLETAMVSHASTHVGFFLVSLVLSLLT